MYGRWPFIRMFGALRWTHVCSMRPDVDWYIGTVCVKIHFLTRHSGGEGECFLGRWPSLNLHSSGFPFPHRGRRLARYQPIVFGAPSQELTSSRRVSFASNVTVLGDVPPAVRSLDSGAQELIRLAVAEEDEMDTVEETSDAADTPPTIIPPPSGFSQFSWPYEDWSVGDVH